MKTKKTPTYCMQRVHLCRECIAYVYVVVKLSTFKFDHLEKKNSTVVFTVYCLHFCLDICVVLWWYCLCWTVFKVVKFKDTHIEHIFTLNCFCSALLVLLCTVFQYFFRFISKSRKLNFSYDQQHVQKKQPRVECSSTNILKCACSLNNWFIYSIETYIEDYH